MAAALRLTVAEMQPAAPLASPLVSCASELGEHRDPRCGGNHRHRVVPVAGAVLVGDDIVGYAALSRAVKAGLTGTPEFCGMW